jgi:hypothetical protein
MSEKRSTKHNGTQDASKDPTSLGNLLLKMQVINKDQLDRACLYQRENKNSLLGEALVRLGALESEVLAAVIDEQRLIRSHGPERSRVILERATTATVNTITVANALETLSDLVLQVHGQLNKRVVSRL